MSMNRRKFIKRGLIWVPAIVGLLPKSADARRRWIPPASAAGPSYTLVYDSVYTPGSTAIKIGGSTDTIYGGQHLYNDSVARAIGKISFELTASAGDISGKTFTVRIWSYSGSALNTNLASSTGVPGDNTWNRTVVPFLISYTISTSTDYAVTIDMGALDASNYASAYWTPTGSLPAAWPCGIGIWDASKVNQGAFSGYNYNGKLYTSP